jgi:hypothetical protein
VSLAWKNQRGDTLVEVALSIAILSVVLTTSFNVANLTFRLGLDARERVQVLGLMQDQAERLRLYRDRLVATTDISIPASGRADGSGMFDALDLACPISPAATPQNCHLNFDANGEPVPTPGTLNGISGTPPNTIIRVQSINVWGGPSGPDPRDKRRAFKIVGTWDAPGGGTNSSQINLVLVDKRSQPIDCSVAGSCL